eukprot:4437370-Prymnesium_polylepis.1
MTGKGATNAYPVNILGLSARGPVNILGLSARGAQRHGTRNTRRQTRDSRRSSIMLPPEQPDHAADTPRPTQPTLPHTACEEREVRSSQLKLH